MPEDPTVVQYWDELTEDERKDRYRWLYQDKKDYQNAYGCIYKRVEEIAGSFIEPYGPGFKCSECGASNEVRCMLVHRESCTASLLISAIAISSTMQPDD